MIAEAGAREALVEIVDLSCDLGDGPVLTDVDLRLEPGTFLGIVGPSGAGKTTLLRTVLGTTVPTAGAVTRRAGLRVGYVPQVETIDWTFPATVTEVVAMASPGRPWISRSERREIAVILDQLGLGDVANRHIRALSGGQQQRVFLARALRSRPDLVLLDEPTSGVDVATRHELLHLLASFHHDGLSIVLSTHDLNGVATHLPELVCLNNRVLARGAPSSVLTPENLEATYGAPFEVLVHAGLPFVVDRLSIHAHGPEAHQHQHHADGPASPGGGR